MARRISEQVAILGCGPAGLLAAEAADRCGFTPSIFSKKVKSEMFGAMFLHQAIPDVTPVDPDFNIAITKVGTRAGYAKNVYGDAEAPVSWDVIPEESMEGWDLRAAYDKLWDKYESSILNIDLDPADIRSIIAGYANVYTTIPAKVSCVGPHEFRSQPIWVLHGDGTPHLIEGVNDHNMMYYNGDTIGPGWYRFSQINRYQCWEFSRVPGPGYNYERYQLSEGHKPISTDCDCWPQLRRLGRFGCWEKGVLTHHAYNQVIQDLSS